MNDALLGVRRQIVADQSAVCRGSEAVNPNVEYPVAVWIGWIYVIVRLKVVHGNEIGRREAPDETFDSFSRINLVQTPGIAAVPAKSSGIIALRTKRLGTYILG